MEEKSALMDEKTGVKADRLTSAYREAVYQFSYQGMQYDLKVGEKNENIDLLLDSFGTAQAAFITAYNPQSQVLSEQENTLNQRRLEERIEHMGLKVLTGFSSDRSLNWPKEESLFILDLDITHASQLAADFNQKGFLYVQRGNAVMLCFC